MPSGKKISDRINEIKTASPYLKYSLNPEIPLFDIYLSNKDELKKFLNAIENSLYSFGYLRFAIEGWRKQKTNGNHNISFSVEPVGLSKEFIPCLQQQLEESGLLSNMKFCNYINNFDVLAAQSTNWGDIEHLWHKLGEDAGILSGLLLNTIFRRAQKPSYAPRKLCYFFDVLEILLFIDDKKYRTYNIPCGKWIQPNAKGVTKNTLEKYRILKNYQLSKKKDFNLGENSGKIFITSDLHLNHSDIIDATARPFTHNNINDMNEVLISNWNHTVNKSDTVIFAGDLTYNSKVVEAQNFLKRLNGNIIFVRGNHDTVNCETYEQYELKYNNYSFLVIHNPKYAPENYPGWIIHGHTHNSRMCNYPFINFQKKTINICCELTEYRPLEINEIINIIEKFRNKKDKKLYSIEMISN